MIISGSRRTDIPAFYAEWFMNRIRAGYCSVPNPFNGIPGFSFNEFYFLPGFPQMAKPMMEWVLDTIYQQLQPSEKPARRTARVYNQNEGMFVAIMHRIMKSYPDLKFSCLPRMSD